MSSSGWYSQYIDYVQRHLRFSLALLLRLHFSQPLHKIEICSLSLDGCIAESNQLQKESQI